MYEHIAPSYNRLHQAEQRRKLTKLLLYVDLNEVSSVLDVGCGTAHCAEVFSCEYLGVDPEQALLEEAPNGVKVLCSAGELLPVHKKYDLVLNITALHNYTDPIKGVDELVRVTGKYLCVGVLKKSTVHDVLVDSLKQRFALLKSISDIHDTLLVLIPKE